MTGRGTKIRHVHHSISLKGDISTENMKKIVRTLYKTPVAACVGGSWNSDGSTADLLIVASDDSGQTIRRERRTFEGQDFVITIVSKRLFDKDVHQGFLGEFVAACLLEPYIPITGQEYLETCETDLKVRTIREELGNLDLRFHDLMLELLIDPRFFFHAKMQRRAKIFPPLRSTYLRFLAKRRNDGSCGFDRALTKMSLSGLLSVDRYVKVTGKLMAQLPKPRPKSVMPFREVELAIRRLATYGIASNLLDPSLLNDISQGFEPASGDNLQDIPDPKSYLFLPTGTGLVPMDDKRGYQELISSELFETIGPRSIRRIGGALNFVYLIEYMEKGHRKKVVAKTYQNWYGLKWIPLSLWTIGSQNFDILGERRLANEYRMNRFLRLQGLHAPEIYHVSIPRRTIIEEFIAGMGYENIAQKALSNPDEGLLHSITCLGDEISHVHEAGATLGDSKPDNIILDDQGKIWFVDLEQASDGGNPAWDLAEFLYYSGHYTLRWKRMRSLADAFLEGYLRVGSKSVVKAISSAKYKRVFGIMTAPHIVIGISKLCRSYGASS